MTVGILKKLRRKEMLHHAKAFFETRLDFMVGPYELNEMIEQGQKLNIIDVRRPDDFAGEHLPGAINLPEDKWATFNGLSKDRPNVIYCYSIVCQLASKAAKYFAEHDFPVMELKGGIEYWKSRDFPLETRHEQ